MKDEAGRGQYVASAPRAIALQMVDFAEDWKAGM